MAGTADGEPDVADLTFELDFLLGDLKGLGYDMHNVRVFQQENRALETAAKIPRQQQQIARLQKMKERILQNSTSALRLASAPSEDRSTKVLKRAHPEKKLSVSADAHEQSAATSQSQDSQPRGRSPKRLCPAVASVALHAHSGQDAEYGHYHLGPFLCVAHVRRTTYEKSARSSYIPLQSVNRG
jgi:hypothetical protein